MIANNQTNGTAEKPTILIVPGSFSPLPLYTGIIDHLERYGYEVVFAQYPSIGRRDPLPPATMEDDTAFVSAIATKLADAGKSILMVTHSYGGIPGTEGSKGLSEKEREKAGKPGGIAQLLYITSLVARVGESLIDLMGSGVAPFLHIKDDYMSHEIHGSAEINFADLPASEGVEWAKLMPNHSTVSFSGKATHEGYRNIPVSYLKCTADLCLVPELQQRMINMMTNEVGIKVDVHELPSGHCPNVSRPKTVGQVIRKIAGEDV